jgi:hypothetical protein
VFRIPFGIEALQSENQKNFGDARRQGERQLPVRIKRL